MRTLECAECGTALPPEAEGADDGSVPCPKCGSVKQLVRMSFSDNLGATLRDGVAGKVKDETRRSADKLRRKFFYGSQLRRSRGDFIYKEQEIDRDANRYRELVREEDGTVIHDVEHPLSEHVGHGSAKFAKKKPGETPEG